MCFREMYTPYIAARVKVTLESSCCLVLLPNKDMHNILRDLLQSCEEMKPRHRPEDPAIQIFPSSDFYIQVVYS